MKNLFMICALLMLGTTFGQVGIGTTTPTSQLDIVTTGNDNTTKALRIENVSGLEMLTVLDNGNVGVGTAAPISKLHVNGEIRSSTGRFRATGFNGNADDGILFLDNTFSNYIYNNSGTHNWRVNGTDRITILNNGNVGIENDAPGEVLTVRDAFQVYRSGLVLWGQDIFDSNTPHGYLSYSGDNVIVGGANPTTGLSLNAGNTEHVRITPGGNVGIGVSNPTTKLAVDGAASVNGNLTANGQIQSSIGRLRLTGFNNSNSSIIYLDNGFTNYIWNNSGVVNWRVNNSDRITILSNGNVGINETNPTQRLHVNGNILASGTITPDYVFERYFEGESDLNPEYEMMSLEEVETFTRKNKHLPGVPSAKEVEEKGGIVLNRQSEILLEKVEELFLHTIEQEKEIKLLREKLEALQAKLDD